MRLELQALGYLYWNALSKCDSYSDIDREAIDRELDIILAELAYDKIWEELSQNDIRILEALLSIQEENTQPLVKVEQIRSILDMSSDTFTRYRTRLLDSGVVDGSQYGYLRLKLPRFEQYIHTRRDHY